MVMLIKEQENWPCGPGGRWRGKRRSTGHARGDSQVVEELNTCKLGKVCLEAKADWTVG